MSRILAIGHMQKNPWRQVTMMAISFISKLFFIVIL